MKCMALSAIAVTPILSDMLALQVVGSVSLFSVVFAGLIYGEILLLQRG